MEITETSGMQNCQILHYKVAYNSTFSLKSLKITYLKRRIFRGDPILYFGKMRFFIGFLFGEFWKLKHFEKKSLPARVTIFLVTHIFGNEHFSFWSYSEQQTEHLQEKAYLK